MMFHRLGLINKNQRGFTLIEVVLAIALTGIITGGITMTFFQVFSENTRGSNHMIAVRQVQNAGYWVSHDTQMAQSVEPAADPDPDGFPLVLTWTEWDGTVNEVTYTLVGDELQREHYTNSILDSTINVAEYVDTDPTKTKCEFAGGVLTLTVTATLGTGSQVQSETRVYEVIPRPSL